MELPLVLNLENPVSVGDAVVSELRFERLPTVGDFRGVTLDGMSLEDIARVAGRVCGQPPSVMLKIAGADIGRLNQVVSSFLLPGPATGA